jgi:hypothetical protein
MTHNVWVTKRNIRGMVSAEARATNRNAMTTTFVHVLAVISSEAEDQVQKSHLFYKSPGILPLT